MISPPVPWQIRYEPGVPASIPASEQSFDRILKIAAANAPGYPALVYFNHKIGYAGLDAAVDRVARAFLGAGLRPGDRVLLALPNCPILVEAMLGALRAGAVLVPARPDATAEQLASLVARSRPAFAVVDGRLGAAAERLAPRTRVIAAPVERSLPRSLRWIHRRLGAAPSPALAVAGVRAWKAFLHGPEQAELPTISSDAPALLAFGDAGDAGRSFAHRHLVAGATQLRVWLTDAMPGDDTWLLMTPLHEVLGLVAGLGTALMLRSRIVLVPGPGIDDLRDVARFLGPAYVISDAPTVTALADEPRLARIDFRSVRAWILGESVSPEAGWAFEAATGLDLCQGFAPEGVAGLAACNPINGRRVDGSIGLPLPGVELRFPEGSRAPDDGMLGPLEIRGPNVAAESWMRAAPLARLDPVGFLHLPSPRP